MKCCLSHTVSASYLQRADEIKIDYHFVDQLPEFFEKYPNKDIVLTIDPDEEFDWSEMSEYVRKSNNRLILCLNNVTDCLIAEELNIRYFYGLPICTYAEFNAITNGFYNPEYIILGAPLFFDLPYVSKRFNNFRVYPNIANMTPFFDKDNVTGTWIRPENIQEYERYGIKCIEFMKVEKTEEEALYRIYMENHKFNGPLSMIIKDLEYKDGVENNLIPEDLSIKRYACRQKCQNGSPCRFCYHMLDTANYELIEGYLKATNHMPEETI